MSYHSAEFQSKAEAFLLFVSCMKGLISPSGSYLDLSMGSSPVVLLSSLPKKTLSESWKAKAGCLVAAGWGNVSISVLLFFYFCALPLMMQINLSFSRSRLWVCMSLCDNNTRLPTKTFSCGFTADKALLFCFHCDFNVNLRVLHWAPPVLPAFTGVRLLYISYSKGNTLLSPGDLYCVLQLSCCSLVFLHSSARSYLETSCRSESIC